MDSFLALYRLALRCIYDQSPQEHCAYYWDYARPQEPWYRLRAEQSIADPQASFLEQDRIPVSGQRKPLAYLVARDPIPDPTPAQIAHINELSKRPLAEFGLWHLVRPHHRAELVDYIDVGGPVTETYSLVGVDLDTKPTATGKYKQTDWYWFNELVAVDGELRSLMNAEDEHLLLTEPQARALHADKDRAWRAQLLADDPEEGPAVHKKADRSALPVKQLTLFG